MVRLGYIHVAWHGDESLWAGQASECAAEQEAFWEYHDLLFERLNQVAFNKENLKQFAAELDLDTEVFNTCLDSNRYRDVVIADTEIAQNFGIPGTPAFLINGVGMQGAQPFEAFQQVIEAELAKQSAP